MSMISEQINSLREAANNWYEFKVSDLLNKAADTIEQLAAKVRAENNVSQPCGDAILIPENATNGDVLKRLLYGKAIITEFIHEVNISVNNKVIGQFDMEWWNSPYKRGGTDE